MRVRTPRSTSVGFRLLAAGACLLLVACAAAGRVDDLDGQVSSDAIPPHPDGQVPDGQVKKDAGPQHDAAVGPDAAIDCTGGCQVAPGPCFDAPGYCNNDVCVFPFKGEGVFCTSPDPCIVSAACDGQGHCVGSPRTCDFPNASGGTCQNGTCQGVVCNAGWKDCNDDLVTDGCETNLKTSTDCGDCDVPCTAEAHATATCATGTCVQTCVAGYKDCNYDLDLDGCETNLKTSTDCGDCDVPCTAGAHATASCATGTCVQSCTSPWQNCDGNWSNGCEIPVGIPYQCSTDGLTTTLGCGTAYCGSGGDKSFAGNWYCSWCSSCKEFGPSSCSWCGGTTGLWLHPSGTACTGTNPCGCPSGQYCNVICAP
jgi:hypothetical protein